MAFAEKRGLSVNDEDLVMRGVADGRQVAAEHSTVVWAVSFFYSPALQILQRELRMFSYQSDTFWARPAEATGAQKQRAKARSWAEKAAADAEHQLVAAQRKLARAVADERGPVGAGGVDAVVGDQL